MLSKFVPISDVEVFKAFGAYDTGCLWRASSFRQNT